MNEQQNQEDERSDDAPLAGSESFGTWLRRQREVRDIELREIADSSKVGMSYLQAFEEDRFEVLPAPVFAKGFLREYARYVGLDAEEVINFYLAACQPEDEEDASSGRTEPEPPTRNYLLFVVVMTAALVLLVWLLSVFSNRSPETPELKPRPVNVDPLPAATGAEVAAEDRSSPGESAIGTEEDGRQAEESSAVPGPPLRVTLDFLSSCWVEASVDGAEKLSELKVQGESLALDAEEVVELKVGDVAAVQVEINGIPFEIKSRRGTSVREVRIDLETAAAIAASAIHNEQ